MGKEHSDRYVCCKYADVVGVCSCMFVPAVSSTEGCEDTGVTDRLLGPQHNTVVLLTYDTQAQQACPFNDAGHINCKQRCLPQQLKINAAVPLPKVSDLRLVSIPTCSGFA